MARLHMSSNGWFGVLLHNRENCTDSEIRSMVSQFGKLRGYHRVNKHGGTDLIFVHFQEYGEAKACLDRLAGDPMFNAMPARPRETRHTKPNEQDDRTKSLTRITDDDGKRRSILRRARSAVDKRANEGDDSTSSDAGETAKRLEKEVRFVRPGESSPVRRPKRSHSIGLNNSLPHELSRSEELLFNAERPPHLQNVVDIWVDKYTAESGVFTSTEVLIYNLPLHVTDGMMYDICNQVVSVLSVEVRRFVFNKVPFIVAAVQLRSPDDARKLKQFLHGRSLTGKVTKVVFSSDFY
uniref:Polyadenylate-binding protein 2 n=2 Tax=Lygus hesperus TaxID=30085 RepID=A0A0A9YZS9_LYGHE